MLLTITRNDLSQVHRLISYPQISAIGIVVEKFWAETIYSKYILVGRFRLKAGILTSLIYCMASGSNSSNLEIVL